MIADWDPPPGVLDYAALADDVSAPEAAEIYDDLLDQTKAIDPAYNKAARLPKGAFSRLSRADRHRLIDDVLMDRAAADYNVRGDPRKLQIETVKFCERPWIIIMPRR